VIATAQMPYADLTERLHRAGMTPPLEGAVEANGLQSAVAQANGVPEEELLEWMASRTGLIPYHTGRPFLSIGAENIFRTLASGEATRLLDDPWLPLGNVGPLLVVAHFNPWAGEFWQIPPPFTIKALVTQKLFNDLREDLESRLALKPLALRNNLASVPDLPRQGSPEAALRWLLENYPFDPSERLKAESAVESLAGVSSAHVAGVKSLPKGYGPALRHLCTGEAVFDATLAPRQQEFPDGLLEKHGVFPLYSGSKTVYLLSPASEIFSFEDEWLSAVNDTRQFRPVIAEKEAIIRLINRDRTSSAVAGGDTFVGELTESGAANIVDIDAQEVSRINPASINTTAEQALHWVLYHSITARSSDLHIEKYFNMARFRARIDGELNTLFSAPEEMLPRYVSLIKNYANMGQERQGAQDGRFSLRVGKRRVDCRVSAIPCRKDQQKITIRYLDKAEGVKKLSELNLSERNLEMFRAAMSRDQGLILITGPTGSGKTTTLYALLNSVNSENLNIQTIEDPIEYEIEGINQTQTDPVHDIDFAQGLRRLMRADPDIILIGECRDEETASAAVNAALTGHLVLTTLHANDCLRAVSRFISMGVPPYLLADSLALTQAQRLVRRLCPLCKRMTPLDETHRQLFAANQVQLSPDAAHIYEAEGCQECRETGYSGRLALMEMCPIDHQLADLISVNAPQGEMRKIASSRSMRTLYQEGLQQVLEGNTSLEEIKCLAYTGVSSEELKSADSNKENGFQI
jgi:type II secretory ATPase GspE/PulE/Tfp pilus assembly ATPase PilB-like protein